LAGNVLGCLLSFGMGYGAKQGFERFQRVKVDLEHPLVQRLRRWGPPALFLSFLPLVGDVLVVAAGWLKLPLGEHVLDRRRQGHALPAAGAGAAGRAVLRLTGIGGQRPLAFSGRALRPASSS
jgi:hypothetical protein